MHNRAIGSSSSQRGCSVSKRQTESTAILVGMMIAALLSTTYYAKHQLVFSTHLVRKILEIAFG